MNTIQNTQQASSISGKLITVSAGLLLIHYWVVCYQAFRPERLGRFVQIFDGLYEKLFHLSLTGDETISKCLVLLALAFSYFFSGAQEPRQVHWKWPLIILGVGLLLFFSTAGLTPVTNDPTHVWTYIAITSAGYLAVIYGAGKLAAAVSYGNYVKRFRRDTGFRQEERLIKTAWSVHFRATYSYNGRTRKSWINIINPQRGVLIMGSPGAGKSWFLIEPMIEQFMEKNLALFVYDFKYPALTRVAYRHFLQHQENYPANTRFYCINFTDLSHSHRCNLIDPATLENKNDAMGISRTILLGINRSQASRQGEFFIESSINYLAALIWFLRTYQNGAYCTLPHVIELSKTSYEELFTILNAAPETRGLVGPFKEAYMNKTMEMLDGQVASARIPMVRLDSPDFYYVLSGNDVNLDINDPNAPAVLCLGGDAQRQEALAPVMSLFIDRLNRRINKPNRHPSALILDEFATVRATSVLTTIATGRSNNIIPVLAVQDLTQLTQLYSHDEGYQIMNTAGNLICGQVGGETARLVSERFHANTYLKTTVSVNSSDTSVSKTEHAEEGVTPATLAQLSSGEFIGVIADDPQVRMELKGFHATFRKEQDDNSREEPLPFVAAVTAQTIKENFHRIAAEVESIVKSETKRILGDPELRKFIVKR